MPSTSREVDTSLPEFSWIPFFRELAVRLRDDGWEDRQPEIVAKLQEWYRIGLLIHDYVPKMGSLIDPFSLYAFLVQRNAISRPELAQAYRAFFGIQAEFPTEPPLLPVPNSRSMLIFSGNHLEQTIHHWETLREATAHVETEGANRANLEAALDASVLVRKSGRTSLTNALFRMDPTGFLHDKAIRRVIGDRSRLPKGRGFGRAYLDALHEVSVTDGRPFPVLALEERLCYQLGSKNYPKKVQCWFVPEPRDDFRSGSPINVGHQGLPAANQSGERGADFAKDVRQGDIVVAQDGEGNLRYGFAASTFTYSSDALSEGLDGASLRNVYWRPTKFTAEELGVDVSDHFHEVSNVRSRALSAIMRAEHH